MRDFLEEYSVARYINAHDTITLYGASRMADNTREAMRQISQCFVDLAQLQQVLGDRIANMTHNEAAYLTNGASGGVQLCAAVCLARGDHATYRKLPDSTGLANEIVVLHSQHNCYDKALEAAGARIRLVGDADEAPENQLAAAIGEQTAAVFYCPASIYARGSLPLARVCALAHEKGVPVIVDAAAQLPPVENLWTFTAQGADMVIFSGGKTLCGPQASGLIVGKQRYIEDCRRFGAPAHGVCRASKTAREDMIGLCVAVENYLALDQTAEKARLSQMVDRLVAAMEKNPNFSPYRVEHGSVGQDYPRAFARLTPPFTAASAAAAMRVRGILIGANEQENSIYLSPLNLTEQECDAVCAALESLICAEHAVASGKNNANQ